MVDSEGLLYHNLQWGGHIESLTNLCILQCVFHIFKQTIALAQYSLRRQGNRSNPGLLKLMQIVEGLNNNIK